MKKYTIQDLADGKCAVKNDGSLNELRRVLGLAFPNDDASVEGSHLYYEKDPFGNNWTCNELTFLPSRSPKHFLLTYSKSKPNSAPETLKQQIDRITKEAEDKIQQIVLDHHQQTGVMVSIRLEYCEMTDKLSGGEKTLMPIITLYSTI